MKIDIVCECSKTFVYLQMIPPNFDMFNWKLNVYAACPWCECITRKQIGHQFGRGFYIDTI